MAKILVIDDQEHIRKILRAFLAIEHHEVDLAESGKNAMKLTELNSYDLVITDVVMPDYDGFDIIKALKRFYPEVKVIAITGGGGKHDIGELLDECDLLGADRALPKPLDFHKLQAVVREVLDK